VLVVLDLNQAVQPRFPDLLKIFLHTHAIVLPVPFVHPVDPLAGILFAFKTEPGQAGWALVDPRTFLKQVSAGLIADPAAGALRTIKVIDIRQILAADSAVHAAGRDQVWGNGVFLLHPLNIA